MNTLNLSQIRSESVGDINAHIDTQRDTVVDLSILVKEGWNVMMLNASLRALVYADVMTIGLIEGFQDAEYAERNLARAEEFRNRYLELSTIELSSKTYIKAVLTPLKELRGDIDEYLNLDGPKKKLGHKNCNALYRNAAIAEAKVVA